MGGDKKKEKTFEPEFGSVKGRSALRGREKRRGGIRRK